MTEYCLHYFWLVHSWAHFLFTLSFYGIRAIWNKLKADFHGLWEESRDRTSATFCVPDFYVSGVLESLSFGDAALYKIVYWKWQSNILQLDQFQGKGYLELQEKADEDELLVKVPGSAYTSVNDKDAGAETIFQL